eukprot:TRINITY_DN6509_c0_g2_i5.p1 TRINITY_DN6509_c0_g2~~TRINITY_DN6509_c0_g2_i5.p1  ORF type:complete len:184 (-),score=38.98 TRINITY_DN6509_c0_g2_i5:21-503(-)
MSKCIGGCGFYASRGEWCSRGEACGQPEPEPEPNPLVEAMKANLLEMANVSDEQLDAAIELFQQSPLTPLELQEFFEDRAWYLLAAQAKKFLTRCIAPLPDNGRAMFIYDHVVYCRVADRWNLREAYGTEGYYHMSEAQILEGVPADDFEVWDHQRSVLW